MRTSKAKEFGRQMAYFARILPKVSIDVLVNISVLAERYERANQLSMIHPGQYGQRRNAAWKRLVGYCEFHKLKVLTPSVFGRPIIKRKGDRGYNRTTVPLEMYCEAL